MTGSEFERQFCQQLKNEGWWALNISRSKTGAQPFDVIAIKGHCIMAVDCKVMSSKSLMFPLKRVEVNQWLSFKSLRDKSVHTLTGLIVWHEQTKSVFFLDYWKLRQAVQQGKKSIDLHDGKLSYRLDKVELLRRIHE